MDTNHLLIFSDLLYSLYTSDSSDDPAGINHDLLSYLRMLIPSSYASLLTADPSAKGLSFNGVYCDPVSFTEAEQKYIGMYQEDDTQWMMHSKVSAVMRESDLLKNESRLHSSIYQNCYQPYNIYDSLQMTIVYRRKFLGVITLFRTKEDPPFTDDDITLLKSLDKHLNYIYGHLLLSGSSDGQGQDSSREAKKEALPTDQAEHLMEQAGLTRRESEIVRLVMQAISNDQICRQLHITANTLQKHMQNIYRKFHISSRLELFRTLGGTDHDVR
ncbi:MAG: helix-turn-helix transcriptional regulator [Eubacterium sp.]|nr:helix-turn-helix transcriptional regulator [Eubacterium sp.]